MRCGLSRSRNARGFSLTEVMVSLGLAGLVSLLAAQLFKMNSDNANIVRKQVELIALQQAIMSVLQNPDSCRESIQTENLRPSAATSTDGQSFAMNIPGYGRVARRRRIQNSQLIVDEFVFKNARNIGIDSDGNNLYLGMLSMQTRKVAQTAGPGTQAPRNVGALTLTVSPTNRIIGCNAELSAASACVAIGGTYNPRNTPPCTLPVAPERCPANQYVVGIRTDGSLECMSITPPEIRFPNIPNPCRNAVIDTYFPSTCQGQVAAAGTTCVWYDGCWRFDAGSGGATRRAISLGFTIVDLPGNRYPPDTCSGGSNEDGLACRAHVEGAK